MTPDSTIVPTPHRVPRGLALVFICVLLCSLSPLQAFAQNTPPVIQTNAGLTLDEGGTSTISASLLLVTDAEQGADSLVFTVETAPASGALSLGATFTQYDIDNNWLTYTHDGGETTLDYFMFSVRDGAGGTISSTPFIITMTPVNDAPVLAVNNGLSLDEGAAATIGAGTLEVTDVDNTPAQLTYTLTTAPVSGTLELSGSPLSVASTFTQSDVNAGFLSYTHDGAETTSDAFVFSFSDGEITMTGNTFNIAVAPVNDSPVIEINDGLAVNEGDPGVTITAGVLLVTDAEQSAALLTYTVEAGPTNGSLSMSTFTQAQIDASIVTYTHDGGESLSDNFTFSVSDGVGGTVSGTFAITVTPVNDSPVVVINDGLTVNEGDALAIIDVGVLLVTDAEQGPASLTYTVSAGPTNGTLSHVTFTQQDINDNYVTYTHDGSETLSDNFTFSVSDGVGGTTSSTQFNIIITPVNDAPVLAVNAGLTLDEGAASTIGTGALQVTDVDNTPAQLTYTLTTAPVSGTLQLSGSPLSAASTFTQGDVNAGFLSYTHDGSETTSDSFVFSFGDGEHTITGNTFAVTITEANDSPVIVVNNGLTVNEGDVGSIIDAGDLLVTDTEQGAGSLTYTVVAGPTNGTLSPGTGFTQQDINDNSVTYTHDGGESLSDNFTFSVSDGVGGTVSGTFVITVTPVNDAPVIGGNNGLSVMRGGSETITRGQLFANDPDNSPGDVLFTVTIPPTAGTLVLNGSPGPSTFTQDDIDYGRLRYDHDGSNSTQDVFSFELSDLTATTGPYDFNITVLGASADPPAIMSIVDVGNDQGRSVLITFQKCGADTAGSPTPVLEYGAFRRIDPLPSAGSTEGERTPMLDGWVFVGTIPANGESVYNIVAPTLADSTAGSGIHWSVFFVRALTAEPTIYFDSAPDSGYSVDNLAPGVPLNLAYEAPGILTWDDAPETDFDFFTVYGSSSATFDETAEVLGHATESSFDVQGHTHAHFFVTATDFNGNEGDPADVQNPTGTTGPALVLKANITAHPNPFNPATTIVYTVEDAGPVTVAVYDATGKLVATLVDHEYREPSEYRIEYRPRGASGVYFVRLETGGQIRNTKLVLLK